MARFADAAREWKQLADVAKSTGSREARLQAEQARIALAHHPAANTARAYHNQRIANGSGGRAE